MQHSPELIEAVWAARGKKSASVIGLEHGLTRNSVIGIWHRQRKRNGEPPMEPPPPELIRAKRNARRRSRRAANRPEKAKGALSPLRAPLVAKTQEIALAPIPETAIQFSKLTSRNCHYPLGGWDEPAELFCGDLSVNGQPYCHFHMRVAYRPVERRRGR